MNTPTADYLDFAMINGVIVAIEELKISPLGAGFMFGEGFFETIRVEDAEAELFDAHYGRLSVSLSYFEATPRSSRDVLHARCGEVIATNFLVTGSLKVIVFKDAGGWAEIILARLVSYSTEDYERGFKLKTTACDHRVDPIHSLKSLNYLTNIYAKRMALAAGFDEAVLVDPRRQVLEGSSTNVFMVKGGQVSTPTLQCGILPGVMRACVIHRLAPPGISECAISLDELLWADEVFVTNSLLGIMPVARIDESIYDLNTNVVTRSLMSALTLH